MRQTNLVPEYLLIVLQDFFPLLILPRPDENHQTIQHLLLVLHVAVLPLLHLFVLLFGVVEMAGELVLADVAIRGRWGRLTHGPSPAARLVAGAGFEPASFGL